MALAVAPGGSHHRSGVTGFSWRTETRRLRATARGHPRSPEGPPSGVDSSGVPTPALEIGTEVGISRQDELVPGGSRTWDPRHNSGDLHGVHGGPRPRCHRV